MRFSVVLMRRNGRRLSSVDMKTAPGIVGDLLVGDWTSGSSFGRAVRVARLRSLEGGTRADPLLPLFDPTLVRVSSDALVIVGIEIGTDAAGASVDYAQGWFARPIR